MRRKSVLPELSDRLLERLAHLLDAAFAVPGTGIRIGLDALLGLIPGLGDLVPGLLSLTLVFEGARRGVPSSVLLRMIANILIDTIVGVVPLLGDLFDISWRSNIRNIELLKKASRDGVKNSPAGAIRQIVHLAILLIVGAVLILISGLSLLLFQIL